MADDSRVRITIEVRPGREPIDGCVRDARGHEQAFSGWLGLIAALDAARPAGRARGETTSGEVEAS